MDTAFSGVAATRAERHAITVEVRYFASARAAVGADSEVLTVPDGSSVAEVVTELRKLHPGALGRVLDAASFLLDGIAVRDTGMAVPDGSELDVLPPFAGG